MRKRLSLNAEIGIIFLLSAFLVGLIGIGIQGISNVFGLIRAVLGLVVVFFIPGYALLGTLFPRDRDLSGIVRLALSISISVAVIPILALILDQLPWGIRLWPIVISEVTVILGFSIASWYRRSQLPERECFLLSFEMNVKGWWHVQDRFTRVVYFIILALVIIATTAAIALVLIPKPGEFFTEFYILGSDGLIETYPFEPVIGEPLTVTVGITNLEQTDHDYRVEIWTEDSWKEERRQIVGQIDHFVLGTGQTFEYPVIWSMPWVGKDQKVEFLLFIDDQDEPYRQLRLWLNVIDSQVR